jgi:hypothetical protein
MKKYLEIIEIVEDETINQPQMLRIEVESFDEAKQKYLEYKDVFESLTTKAQYHEHDHENNIPCVIKQINTQEEI